MGSNLENRSGVIWISGYSAAGKTTVGRHVEHLLRLDGYTTLFLDGDQLRSIFANKWDYSKEARIELALIYFRLCSHLSKQGLVVIISAVAMFDEVREWFATNIDNGLEVYLRVPLEERIKRDSETKKIYSQSSLDNDDYSEPRNADVVIENYDGVGYQEASQIVLENFVNKSDKKNVDYGRTQYWSEYYSKEETATLPSPFAEFCLTRFAQGSKLLEIGCGNGRDSRFFAESGLNVVALDKSEIAIEHCKRDHQINSLQFLCCETHEVENDHEERFDYIYSRFSLHAMTEIEEVNALESAFGLLNHAGHFYIECRSINDSLARKGEVLSPTERIDGHYRRFIDLIILEERLQGIGFEIIESKESRGFAVFKDEDPVVIRITAKKV